VKALHCGEIYFRISPLEPRIILFMKNYYAQIKIHFMLFAKAAASLLALITLGGMTTQAQTLFWNTNGAAGIWTNNPNWGTTAAGPFTTIYSANTDVEFTTNSTLTFGTTSIGNVTVDSNQTVTVTAGGTLSMNGAVRTFDIGTSALLDWRSQTVSATSSAGITKNGAGTLRLDGLTFTTTMNGGFTLNAGTVIVNGAKAFGNGTMTINGGTVQSSGGKTWTPTTLTLGGDFAFAGTGNDVWFMPTGLGSVTRNITNSTSSGSRLFGGIISGSAGVGLTFWGSGSGTINLTNSANSFTGPININGAEVVFQNDGSFGALPGSVTTNAIVIDGGRMTAADGANNAVSYVLNSNRGIQVGATAGTSISVGKTSGLLAYFGVIADKAGSSGILVKQGAGVLALGGTNTYSGGTFINNGTLQVTNGDNHLPVGTIVNLGQPAPSSNTGIFDLNGNNQQIAGLNSLVGTNFATAKNIVTNSAASVSTLTISNTANCAYGDGSITNSGLIIGTINLVKTGPGTQILGDTNTYTGTTTVNAGILALSGGGSIGNSSAIALATGATLDVSARSDGTLNLTGSQTLSGFGTVTGIVATAGTSIIAPGNSTATGILTVSGNATLNGTNILKLYKTVGTNDVLSVGGTLTYGGILTVTNLSGTLTSGDSFKLFNAATYLGSFSTTNLPALSAGLSWTNTLATDGKLSVLGSSTSISSLGITNFSLSGTNIVISGTNLGAGTYYLLASTNIALPRTSWTAIATNTVGGDGGFTLTATNAAAPGLPQEFFLLSTTNNN
jgi:autotransporter-associated beta strand protein